MTPLLVRSLAVIACIAAAAAIALALAWRAAPVEEAAAERRVPIGGPFMLVDGAGQVRDDAEFRGAPMLVAFGYTHCPDVCPTTLQTMADALDAVGPLAADIQPLFITVDPERDTPEVVGRYVDYFHPAMIGLTGSAEQVAEAVAAYRVTARKAPLEDGEYLMDHTALVYLMGPDGAYVTHFSHQSGSEAMAETLAAYLERHS